MKIISFFILRLFFTSAQIVEEKEKNYILSFKVSPENSIFSKFELLDFVSIVWGSILYLNSLIKKEVKIIVNTKKLFYKINKPIDFLKDWVNFKIMKIYSLCKIEKKSLNGYLTLQTVLNRNIGETFIIKLPLYKDNKL